MIDLKEQMAKTLAACCRLPFYAIICLFIISCKATPAPEPSPNNILPSQVIRIHKVAYSNENLSMIALWYTGNAKNWNILSTYNGQLRSASQLTNGDLIRIPADLMIRSDAMSSDFVTEQAAKLKRLNKKKAALAPSQHPVEEANEVQQGNEPVASDQELDEFANESMQTPTPTPKSQDQLIENLLP